MENRECKGVMKGPERGGGVALAWSQLLVIGNVEQVKGDQEGKVN